MKSIARALLVVALAGATVAAASVKFTSTFKSLDAASVSFAGKKVAALVISPDDSLRVSAEEALANELTARGMQGVATYRIAPKEELRGADRAKVWFERANVEGVVAVRPVSSEEKTTYGAVTWTAPYYSTLWGYYGYGWDHLYIPTVERETIVTVETTIYSVSRNELVWAAVSRTKNPKTLQKFVSDLVKETVKRMQKEGLASAQRK